MKQYLDLLEHILTHGRYKSDRTGTGTYSITGATMRFDLSHGKVPLLTTKKIHLPSVIHELIWMISGQSTLNYLAKNRVTIWDEWVKKGTEIYQDLNLHERMDRIPKSKHLEFDKLTRGYVSVKQEAPDWIQDTAGFWHHPEEKAVVERWLDENNIPKRILIDGELGPVYGVQWRNFPVEQAERYITFGEFAKRLISQGLVEAYCNDISIDKMTFDEMSVIEASKQLDATSITWAIKNNIPHVDKTTVVGIDQLANAMDLLKNDPDSRRILVSAWNPKDLGEQALPPCHVMFQFTTHILTMRERVELLVRTGIGAELEREWFGEVADDLELSRDRINSGDVSTPVLLEALDKANIPTRALNCVYTMRSNDVFLGAPFNIAFYGILTHVVAHIHGMAPGELIYNGGDVHLYSNHVEQAKLQLSREPLEQTARIFFKRKLESIDDLTYDDIVIEGYESHPAIKAPVAV